MADRITRLTFLFISLFFAAAKAQNRLTSQQQAPLMASPFTTQLQQGAPMGVNPGLDALSALSSQDGTLRASTPASREEMQVEELVRQLRISSTIQLAPLQMASQTAFYDSLSPEQRIILENKMKVLELTPTQRGLERDYMSSFVMPRVKAANQAGFDSVKRNLLPEAQRDFDPSQGMRTLNLTPDQQRQFREGVQHYMAFPSARAEAEQAQPRRRTFSGTPERNVPVATILLSLLSCLLIQ
ncbi:hypothetical protein CROQUDRAFT_674313 [Cronartium quercuum f. sp. fusiforme G11]|uniref:DUF3106 domain-containing protein n=1 Tax=Cronartium quercuum f. sp. fusiforme G11 TaxID=708437 RepID=A0A9P6T824_9BASI|nr:hypothetical protein CROQUDRAFT_674313 [Cronartium quercuum f. sp. fusiforme G11]